MTTATETLGFQMLISAKRSANKRVFKWAKNKYLH